jgi:putative membrane protein
LWQGAPFAAEAALILNFSDHAANERTFLAWVRTAIAVIAFGFVVERFNLFLRISRQTFGGPAARIPSLRFGELAGIGLMALGLAIVAVAAWRFLTTARKIDDPQSHPGPGSRFDVALAALIFLLGCALAAYLVFNLDGAR